MAAVSRVISFALIVTALVISGAEADVLCVCRCCYLGDCAPLANASWPMDDCSTCTVTQCKNFIQSGEVRAKVARLFQVFQSDDAPLAPNEAGAMSVDEQRLIAANRAASFSSEGFDVCEVVALTEAVSCAQQGVACKVSTDLVAACFDRHAPTVLYTTYAFIFVIFIGLAFGFTKNYLPSFQQFNMRNFEY